MFLIILADPGVMGRLQRSQQIFRRGVEQHVYKYNRQQRYVNANRHFGRSSDECHQNEPTGRSST
eukprot:scaffold554629_cov43-Prasinocladus_malaysianus.AAC.2